MNWPKLSLKTYIIAIAALSGFAIAAGLRLTPLADHGWAVPQSMPDTEDNAREMNALRFTQDPTTDLSPLLDRSPYSKEHNSYARNIEDTEQIDLDINRDSNLSIIGIYRIHGKWNVVAKFSNQANTILLRHEDIFSLGRVISITIKGMDIETASGQILSFGAPFSVNAD